MLTQSFRRFLLPQPVQSPVKSSLLFTAELLDARGQITFANLEFLPVCMGAMSQCVSQIEKTPDHCVREITVLDRAQV